MGWYDLFAVFYDPALAWLYHRHRVAAANALQLAPGMRVLVPACGTGLDLPLLAPAVAPEGAVIGVDLSAGMLAKARRTTERRGLRGVELIERSVEDLEDVEPVDRVLWFLGLSVVPNWERVFAASFDKLKPTGRCVIVDVYAEYRVPQSWIVEWMAQADLSRACWEPLERQAVDFERRDLSRWASIHGGTLWMASGTRGEG